MSLSQERQAGVDVTPEMIEAGFDYLIVPFGPCVECGSVIDWAFVEDLISSILGAGKTPNISMVGRPYIRKFE